MKWLYWWAISEEGIRANPKGVAFSVLVLFISLALFGNSQAGIELESILGEPIEHGQSDYSWVKRFGNADREFVGSISVLSSGDFVVAGDIDYADSSDIWLAKFDGFGNLLWRKSYSADIYDRVKTVQPFLDGYALASEKSGPDGFITRLNGDGGIIWTRVIPETLRGILPIGDQLLVLGQGGVISRLDANGNTLFQRDVDAILYSAALADNGDYVVAGQNLEGKTIIIRLNSNDNVIWQKSYFLGSSSNLRKIEPTIDGDFIVLDSRWGWGPNGVYLSPFLYKIDSSGNLLWELDFPGSNGPSITDVVALSDGGAITTGSFVMRVGSNGQILWQKEYQNGSSLYIDKQFDGYLTIGSVNINNNPDFNIKRINENGILTGCSIDEAIVVPNKNYDIEVEASTIAVQSASVSLVSLDLITAALNTNTQDICEGGTPPNTISGRIADWQGDPLPGVTIWAGFPLNTQTDENGNYSFTDLDAGSYSLTPTLDGYLFFPESRSVQVPPGGENQDFIGVSEADCELTTDADGDGLKDGWEICGYDHGPDGIIDVDLPAMGSDPKHKDIFVEIDYMGVGPDENVSHRPKDQAIEWIVESFDNAPVTNPDGTEGIHLHVDYGQDAPLTWGAEDQWDSFSEAQILPHEQYTGVCPIDVFQWAPMDILKSTYFDVSRSPIFHYSVWAHSLCNLFPKTSGISRNPDLSPSDGGSDFIVSLGGWESNPGSVEEQAGTFMHELGHNLGLLHGGDDIWNHKPNYLSVMNYSFQFTGVLVNVGWRFDYSRFEFIALNEFNLNESIGLGPLATADDIYGTIWHCGVNGINWNLTMNASNVDWDCDGNPNETFVMADIDSDILAPTQLTGHDDWSNLIYDGGAVGELGAGEELPAESEVNELTESEAEEYPRLEKVFIPTISKQ